MTWLPDPHMLAQLPETVEQEVGEDEVPDPRDKFWEEATEIYDTVGYQMGIHVDVCRFNHLGEHVSMADNCPHFNAEDETGKTIRPGWTVQQR